MSVPVLLSVEEIHTYYGITAKDHRTTQLLYFGFGDFIVDLILGGTAWLKFYEIHYNDWTFHARLRQSSQPSLRVCGQRNASKCDSRQT